MTGDAIVWWRFRGAVLGDKTRTIGRMTIHALAAEVFCGFRAVRLHVRIMASDAVKTAAVRLPTATHLYLLDLAQCLRSAC